MKADLVQMSDAEYFADPHDLPSLSASIAHILTSESPLHAFTAHPRLGGEPWAPSREMDLGTLGHAILLGVGYDRIKTGHAALDLYTGQGAKRRLRYKAGEPFTDWKMGAAQDMRDEIREAGCIPVLQREVDEANAMAQAARRQFKRTWLIAAPEQHRREQVALWFETASNGMQVPCRAKIDLLSLDLGMIEDLKTLERANPRGLAKHVETYGSHVQYGAYTSAIATLVPELAGCTSFHWTFVESRKPHCVVRRHPSGMMRQLGETLWRLAVERWAECLDTGEWPGYDTDDGPLEPSPWSLRELIEEETEGAAA